MSVEDFTSSRLSKLMYALDRASRAQADMQTEAQLSQAQQVIERIGEPRTCAELIALVDAVDFRVDALCNQTRTAEARAFAAEQEERLREIEGGRSGRPARPTSLVDFRLARVHARAIELDGDPEDAMSRFYGLYQRLSRSPELGDTRLEATLALRSVLSAAKRAGDRRARLFADLARRRGDALVAEMEARHPRAAASYYHRAAIERRTRSGSAAQQEAIALFEASLPLRADTRRNRQSRGMVLGDLRVLRGEREAGARILTDTALGFEGVLPRHYESARTQLIERDLLLAA